MFDDRVGSSFEVQRRLQQTFFKIAFELASAASISHCHGFTSPRQMASIIFIGVDFDFNIYNNILLEIGEVVLY